MPCFLAGAVEKTRTSTAFRPQRPQRCASTSSATTARHETVGTVGNRRHWQGAAPSKGASGPQWRLLEPRIRFIMVHFLTVHLPFGGECVSHRTDDHSRRRRCRSHDLSVFEPWGLGECTGDCDDPCGDRCPTKTRRHRQSRRATLPEGRSAIERRFDAGSRTD